MSRNSSSKSLFLVTWIVLLAIVTIIPGIHTTNTSTVTAANVIRVQFRNLTTTATSNQLYLDFQVSNNTETALVLSNLKLRYYYTADGTQAQNFFCDFCYAGSGNVTGTFVKLGTPQPNADTYLEIGFLDSAGKLGMASSIEIKCRAAKSDWSGYTQTNDYSFNPTASGLLDWAKVTGYLSDTLVWGIEPGPTPTPAANTKTQASPVKAVTPTPAIRPLTPTPAANPATATPTVKPTPTPAVGSSSPTLTVMPVTPAPTTEQAVATPTTQP